jgi:hypothetical protein
MDPYKEKQKQWTQYFQTCSQPYRVSIKIALLVILYAQHNLKTAK